jgi:hypothetical protein
MQPALLRYYGNAIKLIVTQHTQQELLRYYGNLLCHIAPSLRLLVPSSPQVRRQSVHISHYHLRSKVALDLVDRVVDSGDVW